MKIESKKKAAVLIAVAIGFGILLNLIARKLGCYFLQEFSIIFPSGISGELIGCYSEKREFSNTPKRWTFYILAAGVVAALFGLLDRNAFK